MQNLDPGLRVVDRAVEAHDVFRVVAVHDGFGRWGGGRTCIGRAEAGAVDIRSGTSIAQATVRCVRNILRQGKSAALDVA